MPELVARSPQLPTRMFGNRARWRRDAALVGGVTAYGGAALGLFGLSLDPWLLACTAAGVVVGALLGEIAPSVLERLRGTVPLPVIGIGLAITAGAIATPIAVTAAWLVGAPLVVAVQFAAIAAASQVAIFWLPYTVAAVMRLPRWPVVLGACLAAPLTGPLAKWLILSVLPILF